MAIKNDIEVKEEVRPDTPSRILGYFKDSWRELKNVRWPNRKSTWSMIAAVLAFSALFIIVITLLDILFDWAFNIIIK